MSQDDLENQIRELACKSAQFEADAFFFIYEALEFTVKNLGREGHVTGRELLMGIRDLALEKFGYLAKTVLNSWGVHGTEDFGRIVFMLVENDLMGKTESDSVEDFSNVYDFDAAFVRGFQFKLERRRKPE
ncbi:MAG: hypothetical protein E3J72_05375 [Planctomycetota bacterium]|nr:MAG: hypothetical protein E3J72_05375 [Planctomycetota bacterium]